MVNELAHFNKSLELYYLKINSKDNTIVDEEVYNFSMTKEQVVEALLTNSEQEYYKTMTGHPIDMSHKDLVHGNAAPTSLVKKYLTLHLQDPVKFPTPFEYESLNMVHQQDIETEDDTEDKSNAEDYEEVPGNQDDEQQAPIQVNFTNFSLLPVLTGGVLNKNGVTKGMPLVPDTGSLANVMSMHALKNIGFEECDVDTSVTFEISTATGNSRSKGVINLTLFIKALDDKFYKISERFIVVEYEGLTKILIGIQKLFNTTLARSS